MKNEMKLADKISKALMHQQTQVEFYKSEKLQKIKELEIAHEKLKLAEYNYITLKDILIDDKEIP